MSEASRIIAQATVYVDRGWAVIPLHEGRILPIEREWPTRLCRSRSEVEATWSLYPGANIGIVTGRASGIWVLDIDPDNGGSLALAGLVQAFGRLPETYTVRTPSGGTHYYFLVPTDFEPRNAQHGRRAGRLPAGIDVRGWHGYVAAPPTTRATMGSKAGGTYVIETDFPISPAPEWLLDMIRPTELGERPAGPDPHAQLSSFGSSPVFYDRGRAYAAAAAGGSLGELASALPGTRNETAYRVACRLQELAASPWSGLGADALYAAYLDAARLADSDGQFSEAEAAGVWISASRQVAGRGVALPDADFYGTAVPFAALGGEAAGFSGPGTASAQTVPGSPMFVAPASAAGEPAQVPMPAPTDPRELAILSEMSRQWVRDEAARRLRELRQTPTDWSAEILDDDGIEALADPVWLVDGYLVTDSLARIVGPSHHFKSFVAVDLAACVANGRSWHGRLTLRGPVVYVVAEGAAGIKKRLRAWRARHALDRHNVLVIPRPVQSIGPEWPGFVRHLAALRPRLVVLDTQARVTQGANENDATDMGDVVAAWDDLRRATGACVLAVHHRGKQGTDGRGSSSVYGALLTELDVCRVGGRTGMTISVTNTKQKDAAEAPPLLLTMNVVGESLVPVGDGEVGTSSEGIIFVAPAKALSSLEKRALAIADVLIETNASGETYARARVRAYEREDFGASLSSRTSAFSRAWAKLVEMGRISKAMGREAYYFEELDGLGKLDVNPDKKVTGGPEVRIGE